VLAFGALLFSSLSFSNPYPADEISLLGGADSYERYCAECHGWNPADRDEALYGDDVADEVEAMFSQEDVNNIVDEEMSRRSVDDWPDWAETPAPQWNEEDEDEALRAEILADLVGAIDEVYDSDEVLGLGDEGAGDGQSNSDMGIYGDYFDGRIAPQLGAIDLKDPTAYLYGTSEMDLFRNISEGTGAGMPGFLSELGGERGVWDLVNYIRVFWGDDWY